MFNTFESVLDEIKRGAALRTFLKPLFAYDFGWSFIAQYGRFVLQGISFLLLARVLKADGLGQFSAIMGFVNVLGPFTGWGCANLILKYVARDRAQFPINLGTAILLLAGTGIALSTFAAALGPAILGKAFSWPIFLAMVAAEMLLLRVVEFAESAFQAIERLDLTARATLLSGASRLAAIGLCAFFPKPTTVELYSRLYLITSFIGSAIVVAMMWYCLRPLGRPQFSLAHLWSHLREGMFFSLSIASKSIYTDIDKTMLGRLTTNGATGLYTAAYRIINMGFVPALALISANAVPLFRSGSRGVAPTVRFAIRLLPLLLCCAACISIVLFVAAPLLPILLGPSYAPGVPVLRALVWMSLVQVIHYMVGDTLTAIDRQGSRSLCQFGAAILNILLNLWLIPTRSWGGAVIATYVSEGLLACSVVTIAITAWRAEERGRKTEAEQRLVEV